MLPCDVTYRWPLGVEYAKCAGSFRSPRKNWPHAQICTGITSAASSAGNGTSGLAQSAGLPEHLVCRWRTSSRRFDNDRGASESDRTVTRAAEGRERRRVTAPRHQHCRPWGVREVTGDDDRATPNEVSVSGKGSYRT
jgi:hypothetical protein